MDSGFIINKLRLTGASVESAEINLKPGTNIITGPSNTGKTFIFQCINYMLGGSKLPKPIKHAKSYSSIFLEIESFQDKKFTLSSDLKGGDFQLFSGGIDELTNDQEYKTLARKHNPKNEKTVSAFLLSLSNSYQKKIRTNVKGKTRYISYRDIISFLMINEERIITEDSLIISHYTKATEEKNILKYILTGQDDSDVVESISKEEITHKRGRLELLKELISETGLEIHKLKENHEDESFEGIAQYIEVLKGQYSLISKQFNELNSERSFALSDLEKSARRKRELDELYLRSSILRKHYETDIKRLQSTVEASILLGTDGENFQECPLCKNKLPHECNEQDLEDIVKSCTAEISKIKLLLVELSKSEKAIIEELKELEVKIEGLKDTIEQVKFKLDREIKIDLQSTFDSIDSLNEKKKILIGINLRQDQLHKYTEQKSILEQVLSGGDNTSYKSLTTANMANLSKQIELVLSGCNFPGLGSVSFSEDKVDFVISDEDRALFGKGFRAIIYAAFIVAVQELLADRKLFIGVPVLDSPLVTYKKPNSDNEEIPIDLAMDFYRYVARNKKVKQIIIIENEEPPSDISHVVNHIAFTRSHKVGRYGFIPSN